MMGAGNSTMGHKQHSTTDARNKTIFRERVYQHTRADEPPPLRSLNSNPWKPSPYGPQRSREASNGECLETMRFPHGLASNGHEGYPGGGCRSNYSYGNFDDTGPKSSPAAEYVVAVRNNNAKVVFNIQRESSQRQDEPYNNLVSSPNNYDEESYGNNFHPNFYKTRPSSPASVQEYGYRRNHREFIRGPKFDQQFVRTRSSGPPQGYREHSASRSRFNTNDDEIICPTCGETIGFQIYTCRNMHNSCKNCKKHCYPCGICGDEITWKRNIRMERYFAERKLPCPNKTRGCILMVKTTEVESHLKECPFQELRCPAGCRWRGHLNELSTHFDRFHHFQTRSGDMSEIRLQDITKSSHNVYLMFIGNFRFLFHVKSSAEDRKIYMTVQLIGTQRSASKWSYEVHVVNKDEPRRTYLTTDTCNSFVESVNDSYKKGNCSMLDHSYASTFIHNGCLTCKIFIKKTTIPNGI